VPCAQTHTFEAVGVGGVAAGGGSEPPAPKQADPLPAVTSSASGSSFPVWPVVGGVLAALAALGITFGLLRRRRGGAIPA
jgi:hypothetical protein